MATTIELTFLGTSSAQPTLTRNHSGAALRLDKAVWLFDCGEASQIQISQSSSVKISKVTKIFITHMHGDHVFGLPGLVASCTSKKAFLAKRNGSAIETVEEEKEEDVTTDMEEVATDMTAPPLEIYGPSPLRSYLRNIFFATHTRLGVPYRVHELLGEDQEPETLLQSQTLHPNELRGDDLRRNDDDGCWHLNLGEEGKLYGKVVAAPLEHTIPSLAYVFREEDSPGKLRAHLATPHILRNRAALIAGGLKAPISLLKDLKNGNTVNLPDGTVLDPKTYVAEPRPGRVFAYLGDTNNSINSLPLLRAAQNADLVVHEATNALTTADRPGLTLETVEKRARDHGHSTPQMAGAFAQKIQARELALSHFSCRYSGGNDQFSVDIMGQIRQQAADVFSGTVFTANDLMVRTIPRREAPL